MSQYTPPNFLLAQETHFALGFAIVVAAVVKGLPWYYGAAAILVVDLVKELTFDRYKEHQPFLPVPPWSSPTGKWLYNCGLVDWLFYVGGVVLGFVWLSI